jgi:hypothetical protein
MLADSVQALGRNSTKLLTDSTRMVYSDSSARLGQAGPLPDSLSMLADSVQALGRDSTKLMSDSAWTVYLDSTARLAQFVHKRTDDPAVSPFPKRRYALYLAVTSPAYQRETIVDSLGRFVTIKEMVNGVNVKVPATLTMDEYIKLRYEEEKKSNWRGMVYDYRVKERGDDLTGLLGSITNIEIPVPANPLLSIFGKNVINLRITGAVDIHVAFRSTSSDQVVFNRSDAVRNEPNFNQDVQVNVDGTVGDKLKITADWNTQRTFEYENQLKIKYTGYEDEIIQSVEAGNVSLQTSSLVGSSQSLFGIKAKMQAGPLTLTTLLSQKKGQSKDIELSGGAQSRGQDLQAYQYSTSHYFLDTLYRKFFETLHTGQSPLLTGEIQANQIVDNNIEVWISQYGNTIDPTKRQAVALIDLPPLDPGETQYDSSYSGQRDPGADRGYSGYFRKLERTQYKVDTYSGYVSLNVSVNDDQAIAVAYSTVDGTTYGEFSGADTSRSRPLVLKLIKTKNLMPSQKHAWLLQLKNIYSLGGKDLKEAGFELKVFYTPADGPDVTQILNQNLLELLSLDRYNASGDRNPDDIFDFIIKQGGTIDVGRAEIIFPTLRPFDDGIRRFFEGRDIPDSVLSSFIYPDIYDTTKSAASNNAAKNRYVIKVKSSTGQSSRIPLNAMNIAEGSVQVYLNGIPLAAGTDYTVDYIIGEIQIKKEEALVPGAELKIKYEQNDVFQLASKTLIGVRGELATFPNTALGFTVMNLNQETLSDKVRLGEEPTSNMILGVDGQTSVNLPFLTEALDALPGLRAREMSRLDLSGEAAYILPDPNTKRSPILGDNGASIAYLDDFEGARRTIPLGIAFSVWEPASPPRSLLSYFTVSDSSIKYAKAKLQWYNNSQNYEPVSSRDIWPNRSVRRGQDLVTVLMMDYFPTLRGMYNYSPDLATTLLQNPAKNWSGVQRYISSTAGNLLEQNINYLELWVRASSDDQLDLRRGRLMVNLGTISEDVVTNGRLNSEDVIKTPSNPGGNANSSLQDGEDRGLDMLFDDDEKIEYAPFIAANQSVLQVAGVDPNDPSGDDYRYGTGEQDFTKINGTENNKVSPDGIYPNTEDLNGNGDVDLTNLYAEYEIPLDTLYFDPNNPAVPQSNPLIVGGGKNGWYQIRIPLQEASRVVSVEGTQSVQTVLSNVQYVRLWLSGFEKPVRLRVAEVNLVGNQWLEQDKNDSTLRVSVVNIEDNPEYTSPPGVIRERDKSQPDQEVLGNEQSLSLIINNLPRGESRQAAKFFPLRPADLFNYKFLKMYLHGDPSFNYYSEENYDAEFFIRFGSDTLNFYEYRQPIRPGWDDIAISFSELTSVKAARDSAGRFYSIPVKDGPAGARYGVRGNPALLQIRYLGMGVTNSSGGYDPKIKAVRPPVDLLSGQLWINELRVVDVENTPGYSYRLTSQLKLSDFAQVSANYLRKDPNFHGIDQRFGDRQNVNSWAINSSFTFDKFLPASWAGTTLPFSFSHQEGTTKPKYLPGTDILVDEAAKREAEQADREHPGTGAGSAAADEIIAASQTVRVSNTYSTNVRLNFPWQAWYIRETINKLNYKFNFTDASERSPAIAVRKTWSWDFGVNYAVNFPADLFFQPFSSFFKDVVILDEYKDWKLYLMPITNFSAGLSSTRSRSYEETRNSTTLPRDVRRFDASKNMSFGWKLTEGGLISPSGDVGITSSRDLLIQDNDTVGRDFFSLLKTMFLGGRENRYSQRFGIGTKPKIPNIFDITKYFDLSMQYSVNYSWQNSFQNGDIGKSAGWGNQISFSSNFRLKALTDPWFQFAETPAPPAPSRTAAAKKDTSALAVKDSAAVGVGSSLGNLLTQLKLASRYLIKIPFLDYESITIRFTQGNQSGNSGVVGASGFQNFWTRYPFQGSLPEYGPSRLYQLGLITDPSGTLEYEPKSKFPWVGWKTKRGPRALNSSLQDNFTQNNNIDLSTTRPLWPGASLKINWKVGWQLNKNTSFNDSLGNRVNERTTTSGSVERSYLSIPPFLMFKGLKSNLEEVGKLYGELSSDPGRRDAALAESFERGLEALPILRQLLGPYVPRPNWSLSWGGLEKIGGLSSFIQSMSLEHGYNSSFKRDFRILENGNEATDLARVTNAFAPLIGINATFKEIMKGNMQGSLRFGTTTTYDLNLSAQNIVETFSREISFQISYSRRGFQLPLFGLNLNNDIDMTFSFSQSKNSRRQHDPTLLESNQDGTPLDGTTRTTLEPRIKYVLSSRVSASLFYKYTSIAPDEGASTIPGTSTNEAGLDIHISIQ